MIETKSKTYECHVCFKTPCRLEIFEEFVIPDKCPYGDEDKAEWKESSEPLSQNHSKKVKLPEGYMKT